MRIYTNSGGNPFTLKLLICANLAKENVSIDKCDLNDERFKTMKHLPILELDSGTQIFSSNAAALYLLRQHKEHKSPLCQQWLEWTLAQLTPVLIRGSTSRSNTAAADQQLLTNLIQNVDDVLGKTPFIAGDILTVADVAIWCLLSIEGVQKNVNCKNNVLKWMKTIASLQEVQNALKVLPQDTLSIAALQQSNKFGGIPFVDRTEFVQDPAASTTLSDSPIHNPDVISNVEIETAKANFIVNPSILSDPSKVVLPIPGKRNILITSALPYVNNVPHLGNIIGCVLSADLFARYARCAGYNTLYIGGTDEYGTATETKAIAEKLTPQQICDKYFTIHDEIYKWFNISFDHFGRTTTPEQTRICQELFNDLLEKKLMDIESVDQLLCEKCNRYLADRFVEGICPHPGCGYEDARGDQCDGCGKLINAVELIKPRCNTCGTAPVIRQSRQFFINLPKIEPKLRVWLDQADSKWSNNARVITRAWLREGLKSRCITRDLKWGIPVPYKGFEEKVFYVWFDAPIGYISITNTYTSEWRKWWQPKDKNVNIELFQFMAKDNVPFHSVMFPCTLLGVEKGYTLVSSIMATEYLNYEDGKFSKSRGTGVFGNDAMDTGIPADVWRFYLASARPEGQDSNFSWNELVLRNNSELLNNLGNFINRSLVFCEKNFNSMIPAIQLTDDELTLLALVNRELNNYVHSMERAKFRDGLKHILTISRHGNQYMQSQQPWVLLKGTDDEKSRGATVIGLSCNLVCLLATLLYPFMPDTSKTIYNQLNTTSRQIRSEKPYVEQFFEAGHKIGKPSPLFAKIEQTKLDEMKNKFGGSQQQTATESAKEKPKTFTNIDEADKGVAEQAEKVRVLKASGAEKSVWQPEVQILLEFKKQLKALQSNVTKKPLVVLPSVSVEELESKIAKQAEKVRELKGKSSDKSTWAADLTVLLALKKELQTLKGDTNTPNGTIPNVVPAAAAQTTGKNKKKKK